MGDIRNLDAFLTRVLNKVEEEKIDQETFQKKKSQIRETRQSIGKPSVPETVSKLFRFVMVCKDTVLLNNMGMFPETIEQFESGQVLEKETVVVSVNNFFNVSLLNYNNFEFIEKVHKSNRVSYLHIYLRETAHSVLFTNENQKYTFFSLYSHPPEFSFTTNLGIATFFEHFYNMQRVQYNLKYPCFSTSGLGPRKDPGAQVRQVNELFTQIKYLKSQVTSLQIENQKLYEDNVHFYSKMQEKSKKIEELQRKNEKLVQIVLQ